LFLELLPHGTKKTEIIAENIYYRLGLPALPRPLPNLGTAIVDFLLPLLAAPRLTLLPWPPPSEGVPIFLPSKVSIILQINL